MTAPRETDAPGSARPPRIYSSLLILSLAAVALPWIADLRQLTYIRQLLLEGLAAPLALTVGLLAVGPSRAGLKAALAGWPARVFLGAVGGHAALAWASCVWTSSPEATVDRAVELTALALWAAGWLLASAGGLDWRWLARGHYGVGVGLALLGVAAWAWMAGDHAWFGGEAPPPRLDKPIGNPNTVGVLMIFPIVFSAARLADAVRRRALRALPAGLAAGALAAGLFTFWLARGRSGLVGLLVAGVVLVGLRLKARGRLILAALVLAAILAAAFLSAEWLGDRGEEQLKLSSVGARYYGVIASWRVFAAHPLAGAGAGAFLPAAQAHIPPERYLSIYASSYLNLAHNEYAQTAAELGLAGLLILLAMMGATLAGAARRAARGPDDDAGTSAAALAAVLAGVAVSSLADPSLRFWDFTGFYYAAAALAAGASRPDAEVAAAESENADFPTKAAVGLGGNALALLATIFWVGPDARRQINYARATRLAHQERYAEACERYRVAAEERGNFAYRVLARQDWYETLAAAGRKPEALTQAEKLAVQMPDCPLVLRPLALLRLETGDRPGALAAAVRAGRLDPFQDAAGRCVGRVLYSVPAAERPGLIAAADRELQLAPDERSALAALSAAVDNDWKGALAALGDVPDSGRGFLRLDYWRAICAASAHRPAGEALAALERHLGRVPLHADGWLLAAQASLAVEEPQAADLTVVALKRYLELSTLENRAYRVLAGLSADAPDQRGILDAVAPLLRENCRRLEVTKALTDALMLKGRRKEARRVLEWGWQQTRSPELKRAMESLSAGG